MLNTPRTSNRVNYLYLLSGCHSFILISVAQFYLSTTTTHVHRCWWRYLTSTWSWCSTAWTRSSRRDTCWTNVSRLYSIRTWLLSANWLWNLVTLLFVFGSVICVWNSLKQLWLNIFGNVIHWKDESPCFKYQPWYDSVTYLSANLRDISIFGCCLPQI